MRKRSNIRGSKRLRQGKRIGVKEEKENKRIQAFKSPQKRVRVKKEKEK